MPEARSKSYTLARNTAFLYLRMIIVMLVSLYTSRVILRTLGFEDFGIYNVVGSVVVFMSFLQAALRNATSRYIAYDLGVGDLSNLSRTFSMAVNSHLLLAVVFFIGVGAVGEWIVMHKLNIPPDRLHAAGWAFLFSLTTFCLSIVRTPFESNILAHEKMDFYALVSVLDAFLKLGIVFLLPYISYDNLATYAALYASINLLNLLLYAIYAKWYFSEIHFMRPIDRQLFRSMIGFSGWNIFGSFSGIMKEQGINLIINFFCGPIVNAARALAAQINAGLMAFVSNIIIPVRPQVV